MQSRRSQSSSIRQEKPYAVHSAASPSAIFNLVVNVDHYEAAQVELKAKWKWGAEEARREIEASAILASSMYTAGRSDAVQWQLPLLL